MLFSSLFFLYVFLPLLLICYFISKDNGVRRGVLIVFSLLFYAWGEPIYVFLMIGMIALNYLAGRLIDEGRSAAERKLWLWVSVAVNLGFLVFFKYLGFLFDNLSFLPFVPKDYNALTMPIGISFFTFQAMSYTIDVYRGDTPVQRSFPKLLLYVSLFPQLVAGPIVRYRDIANQMENRAVSVAALNEGAYRFSVGLLKKVLIANACGSVADSLLTTAEHGSTLGSWIGAVFFSLQIYYDFSGYSDMAIGLGRIFGFEFLENFRYPYVAGTVTEFWRRWHISLSSFFRDYVYIPLGGKYRNQLRNILIVWFLTGLWHGASWNFILWGLFYGILLLFEKKFLLAWFESLPRVSGAVIRRIYIILVTLIGWSLFYYADHTFTGLGHLIGIGVPFTDEFATALLLNHIYLLIVAIVFALPVVPTVGNFVRRNLDARTWPVVERVGKTVFVIVSLAVSTVMLAGSSYNPFLYFRF